MGEPDDRGFFDFFFFRFENGGGDVRSGLTAIAQLVVPQIEHCTLSAPLGYISTTRHCGLEQTSWAMSLCWSGAPGPPEGNEGPTPPTALVMWPQRAQRTFWAPWLSGC